MSYFECPDCHEKHSIFGVSKIKEISEEYGIDLVAQIPIVTNIASVMDSGSIEAIKVDSLDEFVKALQHKVE